MISLDSLQFTLQDPDLMLPLLGSLVAGALIGAEREAQGKSAGLRTHSLVAFTSALMTLIALRQGYWGVDLAPGTQLVSDLSRMPHAIMTGIGFLCAGVIFRHGASVHGLTTAASLWVSAGLGIVYGAGELELALIGTLITFIVLTALRVAQRLAPPPRNLRISLRTRPEFEPPQLRQILADHGLTAGAIAWSWDQSAQMQRLSTLTQKPASEQSLMQIAKLLRDHPAVQEFEIDPIEAPLA